MNAASSYQLSTRNYQLLSWHGWQLALPEDWSPVKIEGDWNKGSILIADFHATRLALRWQSAPKRKFDAPAWTEQAIRNEVGELMLKESVEHVPSGSKDESGGMKDEHGKASSSLSLHPSSFSLHPSSFSTGRLFVEPDPPGRDVWVGQSSVSNRLIEVVYQTKVRSSFLRDRILTGLSDQPTDRAQHWSIFDLSCDAPDGWTLKSQRLNAGDLTLSFGKKNEVLIVRQIAPAGLALGRQSLETWLAAQQRVWKKLYRAKGEATTVSLTEADDRDMTILVQPLVRRRRFFLARWVAASRFTLGAHDRQRDRLVFVDASSLELATRTLATVGGSSGKAAD